MRRLGNLNTLKVKDLRQALGVIQQELDYIEKNTLSKEDVQALVEGDLDVGRDIILADGKEIGSKTFLAGFLGRGWRIGYDSQRGDYTLTTDNLVVRGGTAFMEILFQQVRATNGSLWITSTGKVETFEKFPKEV